MNEIEKRKLDLAERQFEADLELRKEELKLKKQASGSNKKGSDSPTKFWKSPIGLAVVGGFITLLSASLTNYVQGCNNRILERQKFQSELIQHAIESADDNEAARINLKFLWNAGLISDYAKVEEIVSGTAVLPSSQTYGVAQSINGRDDRIRVREPGSFPFNAICRLNISANGTSMLGTGFFVAPNIVLTAAYNIDQDGTSVEVLAGPETAASGKFAGGFESTEILLPTGWTNGRNDESNFGAIILPMPVENIQPLELELISDQQLSLSEATIAGYPFDRDNGSKLWMSSGFVTPFESGGLSYFIDTGHGTAGAPLLVDLQDSPAVIGIHHSSGEMRAVRVTNEVIEQVAQWIADYGE
ncbi:MAG: hypothetical protein AAF456_13615 [Planctomycetota bacterium]